MPDFSLSQCHSLKLARAFLSVFERRAIGKLNLSVAEKNRQTLAAKRLLDERADSLYGSERQVLLSTGAAMSVLAVKLQ
jgi:hypothetical protein